MTKTLLPFISIKEIKRHINKNMIKTFINAFITSNLDYCNILYYDLPISSIDNLKKVQKTAIRLITGKSKYDHITITLVINSKKN